MNKLPLFLTLVTTLLVEPVFAADIASDVRKGAGAPDYSNGGYFEVGLSANYANNPIEEGDDDEDDGGFGAGLVLAGGYRYEGFFFEASQGSFDGLNLGYHLWNNQRWSVDFLANSSTGLFTLNSRDDNFRNSNEARRNRKLEERRRLYSGLGFRLTGYFDNYILQYRLVTDTNGGDGVVSTARLGRSWQVKNWNFHGVISAQYTSAETNRSWHGVSDVEATTRFPEYDPGESVSFSAEIGVTYPLGKDWVFRSFVRYAPLSDEVKNSPLIDDDHGIVFFNSISYVF